MKVRNSRRMAGARVWERNIVLRFTFVLALLASETQGHDRFLRDQVRPAPGGVATAQEPVVDRLPIPTVEKRKAILRRITSVYRDEFDDPTAEGKSELARKLRGQADELSQDPDGRFVFLDEARQLSIATLELANALSDIAILDRLYAVDGAALRIDAVDRVASLASVEEASRLADDVLDLVAELLASNGADAADRVLDAARPLRTKLKGEPKKQRWHLMEWNIKARAAADRARARLEHDEGNARDMRVLGRYLCLVETRFDEGLPLLKLSKDRRMGPLAEADLARPEQPEKQVKLADRWVELAGKVEVGERRGAVDRALYWYEAALPDLDGTVAGALVPAKMRRARALVEGLPSSEDPQPPTGEGPSGAPGAMRVKRVGIDAGTGHNTALIVYYTSDADGNEIVHGRVTIGTPGGTAGPEHADFWREQVRLKLPEGAQFERKTTLHVTRPYHPADHGNGTRCSWSCQLEGKGPGKRDATCTTNEVRGHRMAGAS